MNTSEKPSKAQVAEAAAWVAHLHGADRSSDSDRGLQLWLKEHPGRRQAWEAATEVWEEVGNLRGVAMANALNAMSLARHRSEARRRQGFALAAAACAIVIGIFLWIHDRGVSTGIGEQRIVALEDGTRITLNTDTRIVVRYEKQFRRVELKSGEARFDVAKDPLRPFLVDAGDRQVRALGTSFAIRYDPQQRTAVTLFEGKVAIDLRNRRSDAAAGASSNESSVGHADGEASVGVGESAGAVVLAPGQRLTFARNSEPRIDRPALEKVSAWQRGEVVMDGTSLADAVAEMNRYSSKVLVIEQPQAARLVISGVFSSGDSLSFAKAVAHTYRLDVVASDDEIVLSGVPQAAYR